MIRLLLIAVALLFLSGCVSNPGKYYSYEGAGDYYYEDAGADVIIDSYPYGTGWGYAGGLGYASGWGFGGYGYGGFGYGFGSYYGGYGYPWGYGYSPIWWGPPTVIVVDSPRLRPGVEEERARRVALSHRPDGDLPESATWARRDRVGSTAGSTANRGALPMNRAYRPEAGRAPAGAYRQPAATIAPPPAAKPSSSAAPVSRSTSSSFSRPSSGSTPMRSAPASRGSGRKH